MVTDGGRGSGPLLYLYLGVYLGGRSRERREEIDRVVVRVDDLSVALAPEGIPGLLLRSKARRDDTRVRGVDVARRGALEGEAHGGAFRLNPIRPERLDATQ